MSNTCLMPRVGRFFPLWEAKGGRSFTIAFWPGESPLEVVGAEDHAAAEEAR